MKSMAKKEKKVIKCEGRFSQLRDYLYNEVIPTAMEKRSIIKKEDLTEMWELANHGTDLLYLDPKDPYYLSRTDMNRKGPPENPLSLVPLLESGQFYLEPKLISEYALEMGNNSDLATKLAKMGEHPLEFWRGTLGREGNHIVFPNGKNMGEYKISGNFGIGTIATGGVHGGGIRSDSPFLFEVQKQKSNGERDLVALIGFWAQENNIVIYQMQSCKNANFPDGVPFGVGCLRTAECIAKELGFKKIIVPTARMHPIFREFPDNWRQFGAEFVAIYDNSSSKLGYNGSRRSNSHEKDLAGTSC